MERTAATGDWGLLLQSVRTHVSSSHVDLLEQKKVFTYEKSWTPTGLTNMAEKSGNFKNGCRLTYDVFTGCLTLKLDVKNTSRPHPHPPPQPWFQTLSPGKKERVRDQGCASPKNAFWDFVHANNYQQLGKYKKRLLNQWQLHFKWSKVVLCNFLIKLNKTDRTSENKGTILQKSTWNKSSTIYLRDLQTSNGRLQGLQ